MANNTVETVKLGMSEDIQLFDKAKEVVGAKDGERAQEEKQFAAMVKASPEASPYVIQTTKDEIQILDKAEQAASAKGSERGRDEAQLEAMVKASPEAAREVLGVDFKSMSSNQMEAVNLISADLKNAGIRQAPAASEESISNAQSPATLSVSGKTAITR